MPRLPQPGADDGTWGDILNNYLLQSHAADGTLKTDSVGAAQLQDNSVNATTIADGSITEAQLDTNVQTKLNASGGDPTMGGDLSGTASNAQIIAGAVTDNEVSATANIAQSKIANLASDLAAKQNSDTDLTAIAGLSPLDNDVMQRKAGAWTNRTPAQLKTDLVLTSSDVGLGNVDNTSDATKNSAIATLTNKTISGASNTLSNIPESAVTNLTTDLAGKASTATTITGATSLTGGGDLSTNRTISLVNDAATPGNSQYYGTDGTGTKGYFALPSGGASKIDDLTDVDTSTVAPVDGQTLVWNGTSSQWKPGNTSSTGSGGTVTPPAVQKIGTTIPGTQSTFTELQTGTDITLAAHVGDIIAINWNARIANHTNYGLIDLATMNGSTILNRWLGGGTDGVNAWVTGANSGDQGYGSIVYWTVVAGDLVGGNVTFRLFGRATGSSITIMDGTFSAQNLSIGGVKMALLKVSGTLAVGTGATRLYNDTGSTWTLASIRASVETAPSGGSVVIDVNKNDVTLFTTQANRPTITTGTTTSGKVTTMDVTSVADGDYLTVDVDTTTSPAADLTVTVTFS